MPWTWRRPAGRRWGRRSAVGGGPVVGGAPARSGFGMSGLILLLLLIGVGVIIFLLLR